VRPAVTVIEQPTYEIGSAATELLLKRIEDNSRSHRQLVLRHHLVVRESSGRKAASLSQGATIPRAGQMSSEIAVSPESSWS
jgi:hypothetical protein